MKIKSLLSFNRNAITCLATVIANANIPGFKAKSKHVIEALAQYEGLSPEAFLVKVDQETDTPPSCIKKITKEAMFITIEGKNYLCSASVSVNVVGYWSEMVQAHQAMFDFTGNYELYDITPTVGGGGRDKEELESNAQASYNLFEAYGYVINLCKMLNDNKRITKEELERGGWEITILAAQPKKDSVRLGA